MGVGEVGDEVGLCLLVWAGATDDPCHYMNMINQRVRHNGDWSKGLRGTENSLSRLVDPAFRWRIEEGMRERSRISDAQSRPAQ